MEISVTRIPISKYFQLLRKYLLPLKGWMLVLAITLLAYIAMNLYAPQFLKRFLNETIAGAPVPTLISLAIAFGVANLSYRALEVLVTYLSARVSWAATNALREDFLQHCLSLAMPYHNQRTSGEMIERIDGDISNLREFFSTFVTRLLGSALLLLGILFCLFRENLIVGAAFTGFAIATLFICGFLRLRGVPAQVAAREASSQMYGFLEQRISGAEDIRSTGGVSFAINGFLDRCFRFFRKSIQAALINHFMLNIAWLLFYAANACALGIGAYYFVQGEITLGSIYVIYHYVSMLRNPIEGFVREFESLTKADASIERISDTLNSTLKIADEGTATLPKGALSVELADVSLSYNGEKKALENVSLRLEPGTSLGLIGETGSGKSSLARLLFRFYEPTQGRILLTDQPATSFTLQSLREGIAFAGQDTEIFDASVFDNVTLFDSSHTREEVKSALAKVGLATWLEELPHGLDSLLGQGEAGLSAGQRQLLAMTRIFLKDASLVILDEPTADLDPGTEELFSEAMSNLLEGRTAIVIAHRLSTLRLIDRIAVLEGGKLVETGDYKLLKNDSNSRFAKALALQEGGNLS